jgi:hypothetical protein
MKCSEVQWKWVCYVAVSLWLFLLVEYSWSLVLEEETVRFGVGGL